MKTPFKAKIYARDNNVSFPKGYCFEGVIEKEYSWTGEECEFVGKNLTQGGVFHCNKKYWRYEVIDSEINDTEEQNNKVWA